MSYVRYIRMCFAKNHPILLNLNYTLFLFNFFIKYLYVDIFVLCHTIALKIIIQIITVTQNSIIIVINNSQTIFGIVFLDIDTRYI